MPSNSKTNKRKKVSGENQTPTWCLQLSLLNLMSMGGGNSFPSIRSPMKWKKLDTIGDQFMVGFFCNPHVLANLCNYCGHVNIHCSTGMRYFSHIGLLKYYGSIWYDSAGIVNILLFTKVKIIPPMLQWCWGIHSLSKIKKWFHLLEGPTGLYYHNTKNWTVSLIRIFKETQHWYTQHKLEQAIVVMSWWETHHPGIWKIWFV